MECCRKGKAHHPLQAPQLLHQHVYLVCADSWSLTIDLSTINALQLQVDSGKALPHLDKTILHTHSLKSAYNLISGEACCKSKAVLSIPRFIRTVDTLIPLLPAEASPNWYDW